MDGELVSRLVAFADIADRMCHECCLGRKTDSPGYQHAVHSRIECNARIVREVMYEEFGGAYAAHMSTKDWRKGVCLKGFPFENEVTRA